MRRKALLRLPAAPAQLIGAHNGFNISTASAFVAASAVSSSQHVNRSDPASAAGADVLGVTGGQDRHPRNVMAIASKEGIAFLSPRAASAMKHAIVPRREIASGPFQYSRSLPIPRRPPTACWAYTVPTGSRSRDRGAAPGPALCLSFT
jgi:hypothetical protein